MISQAIKMDVGHCFFLARHGADEFNICTLSTISSDLKSWKWYFTMTYLRDEGIAAVIKRPEFDV